MKAKKRYMVPRLTVFAVAMLTLALAGSGCIFSTRDAEPPDKGAVQISLDDPQDVFVAMREGLEKDAVSSYERAIGDDFIFSPLLDDSLDQNFIGPPSAFEGWNREVELDVTNLLLSEADTVRVDFSPSPLINDNTFVRFKTTYSIRVVLRADGSSTTYEGVANIDVRRIGGIWQVEYWDEIATVGGASTWGFLRGILRQRL
jgi:hypothetical protein